MIYIIGSLRNPEVPKLAMRLRSAGINVFADWFGAGEIADDRWQAYEKSQGFTLEQALQRPAAQNVFNFDKRYLQQAHTVVLVAPAGKSGHLELGWALGQGKKGYVLFDQEPERWDVMLAFADGVFTSVERLLDRLQLDAVQATPIRWHDVNNPDNQGVVLPSTKTETYVTCGCDYCQGLRR